LKSPAIDALVESIIKDYEPEMVLLFGSEARGDATEHSDIDIIIIKETQKRYKDRVEVLLTATKPRIPVDLIVYTPQEFRDMVRIGNRFVEKALRDGVVIYDKVGYYTEVKEGVTSGRIDMRPDPMQEGRRWLGHAERTLARAQYNYNGRFHEGTCFECQQTAEIAMKAFLYSREKATLIHILQKNYINCVRATSPSLLQ